MPARLRSLRAAALGAVILGLVLRLATAGSQSYWYDEIFTVHIVDGGWSGLWHGVEHTETTPPLYYLVGWVWAKGVGVGELALRSLSALCGAGTILLVMRLAWLLGGRRAAVWGGLLAAVSPLLVWYGQEARAYALLALAAAGLTCALVSWHRTPEPWRATLEWSAWAGVAIATHYFGWILVAASLLTIVIVRGFALRRVLVALAFPTLVAASLLPLLRTHRAAGRADWIAETPLAKRLAIATRQLMVGPDAPHETAIGGLLLLAMLALVVLALLRGRSRERVLVAVLVGAIGTCALASALVGVDFVLGRNLIIVLPPLLALAAVGISTGPSRWSPASLVGGLVVAAMLATSVLTTTDPGHARPDWRGAVEAIPQDIDAVVVDPSLQEFVVSEYRGKLTPVPAGASVRRIAWLAGRPSNEGTPLDAPHASNIAGVTTREVSRRDFGQVTLSVQQLPRPVPAQSASAGGVHHPLLLARD